MRFPHLLALTAFLAGAIALTAGLACGSDSKPKTAATATAAATSTPTETATATATPTMTPTATPTPFNGAVSRMVIPKFGVDAPIEPLALDANNVMQTPTRENTDVAWYHIWDKPGWGGNAVFSAHIYWNSIPGPFRHLAEAKEGDEIDVVMENGTTYKYQVISNKTYNADTIPMGDIIWPPDRPANAEWITMITCSGGTASNNYDYVSRDVVVAQRVS